MPYDRLFDCFNCIEKDIVQWLFNIKNLIYKRTKELSIQIKRKYALFTDIISKPDAKKTVYLRLSDLNKDNENEKKYYSA